MNKNNEPADMEWSHLVDTCGCDSKDPKVCDFKDCACSCHDSWCPEHCEPHGDCSK